VRAKGYAGADCLAASKSLEQALGVATGDVKTPVFFQGQAADQALEELR
jgi:hypothetical protein